MVIRKYADSRDFKKLLELFKTEGLIKGELRKNRTKETLRKSLNKAVTYVAYEEEDLVGFVRGLEDLPFEPLVRDVYVKPLYRRKGIGKSLYLLQDKTERKQRRKKRKTRQVHGRELYEEELFGSDDFHYMIMGYTSGGASYGVTWEEAYEEGLIEREEGSIDLKREEKAPLSESFEDDELPF
ncbi:GNAT family N-acetyltransferase [Proteiniclasticum ruminis]|uniref:GNAT family N-acetyltransferase n=1 Tax=Proteiniclasticum ruminis TaxID=398199 RepID=UPI0028AA40EB|nr:GNAT family N-acetyltransferase [Proteiniclasticum ruminis]